MSGHRHDLLAGIRVTELAPSIGTSYATRLLADLGAEVVKLEPPGGDPLRRRAAVVGRDDVQRGLLQQWLDAGKASVLVDLATPEGVAMADRAAVGADVVIEGSGADGLGGLGMDVGRWREQNPRLSVVSLSNFGLEGPWRDRPATEFTLQASAGYLAAHGDDGREPLWVPGNLVELYAGTFVATAAATAVLRSTVQGTGEDVDVSRFEAATLLMSYPSVLNSFPGPVTYPRRYRPVPSIEPTADGYVGVNVLTGQHWLDLCAMIGAPDLADDRDLMLMARRLHRADDVYGHLRPWLAERSSDEVVALGQAFRIPVVPVTNGRTLPEVEQFVARRLFVEQPGTGARRPRSPYIVDGLAAGWTPAAPAPGSTTTLPPNWTPPTSGSSPAHASERAPLDGIRVLDLGGFWAAPFAAEYLASMGADVVKVESTRHADGFRFSATSPDLGPQWYELSPVFAAANLDKRAVTLDLTTSDGHGLVERLVASADVLVENFTPRVLDALGMAPERLRELNPGLIVVRMPAFGLDGPWRDFAGFALSLEQVSGLAWVAGYPGEQPTNPGGGADALCGMHAAVAIVAALARRRGDGRGALIEIGQAEVLCSFSAEQVLEHSGNGVLLERAANRGPDAAPQGVYRCRGEDRWLAVAVANDDQWLALRGALGDPAWAADTELDSARGRHRRHDELDVHLGEWAAGQDLADAEACLLAAGVPAAAVIDPPAVDGNPQLESRGFFESLDHPLAGTHRYPTWPMTFSRGGRPFHRRGAPTLGQHNDEILGAELGCSPEELERLAAAGVVGTRLGSG